MYLERHNGIKRNSGNKSLMFPKQWYPSKQKQSNQAGSRTHFWHMGAAILKVQCCKSVDANVK